MFTSSTDVDTESINKFLIDDFRYPQINKNILTKTHFSHYS
jgi:hypothetical protein